MRILDIHIGEMLARNARMYPADVGLIERIPAKEAGTPILGSPYPTTKASCQVLPGGLEKAPHILGICFLDILLSLFYIRLILNEVLIIYHNS